MNRRKLLQLSLLAGSGAISAPAFAIQPSLGDNFKKTNKVIDISPHKASVIEVFGYTCPHCHAMEPSIHEWLETKPKHVHFERMPAVFNSPAWIFMARVFYTQKELGILEKGHNKFFDAIHVFKLRISGLEDVSAFFEKELGVNKKDFENTFKGFKVEQLVRKAAQTTQDFGISGVPAVVINGQYVTDEPMAKGKEPMWELVDKLLMK